MRRAILLVLALFVGAGVMEGCEQSTLNHPWWLSSERCGVGDSTLNIGTNWNAFSRGTTYLRATSNDCGDNAPTPIAAGSIGVRVDLYDHDGFCKDGGFGYYVNAQNSNQVSTGDVHWTGPETCQVNNSWEDYWTATGHVIEYPWPSDPKHYGNTNSPVIRFCRGSCA